MANHHHLCGGLADFGEAGELGHHLITAAVSFNHQHMGCRLRLIHLNRRGDATELDGDMGA